MGQIRNRQDPSIFHALLCAIMSPAASAVEAAAAEAEFTSECKMNEPVCCAFVVVAASAAAVAPTSRPRMQSNCAQGLPLTVHCVRSRVRM